MIDCLGATCKRKTLSLTTMDSENVNSQSLVVSLEVCDLQGRNTIELPNVFFRSKLRVAVSDIPLQNDVDRGPNLKGINLPCTDAEINNS